MDVHTLFSLCNYIDCIAYHFISATFSLVARTLGGEWRQLDFNSNWDSLERHDWISLFCQSSQFCTDLSSTLNSRAHMSLGVFQLKRASFSDFFSESRSYSELSFIGIKLLPGILRIRCGSMGFNCTR